MRAGLRRLLTCPSRRQMLTIEKTRLLKVSPPLSEPRPRLAATVVPASPFAAGTTLPSGAAEAFNSAGQRILRAGSEHFLASPPPYII